MAYPPGVVERAMKVQEVIVRALAGKLTWLQAADILGRSPRSIRRLRFKSYHVGIIVCGLQMGHRFQRVDAGYILRSQYLLLQERGHEQRPL